MSLLDAVDSSPFKKEWLSRACRLSSPGRFSRLIHGKALPSSYELRTMSLAFTKLGIMSQTELVDAVRQNADALKREIDLDALTVTCAPGGARCDRIINGDAHAKKKEAN